MEEIGVKNNHEEPFAYRFKDEDEAQEAKKTVEGIEKNFEHTRRIDFLTDEQKKTFKDRIQSSKGIVRIIIHPTHVGSEWKHIVDDDGRPDYSNYPPMVVTGRTMYRKDAPPTILFIDETQFDDQRDVFEEVGKRNGVDGEILYTIPTLHNNGYVKLFAYNDPVYSKGDYSNLVRYGLTGMQLLVPFFCEMGVKKIMLAGSQLKVDSGSINHCVGSFLDGFDYINTKMMDGGDESIYPIKIQVGATTVPHGRKELRENGFDKFL